MTHEPPNQSTEAQDTQHAIARYVASAFVLFGLSGCAPHTLVPPTAAATRRVAVLLVHTANGKPVAMKPSTGAAAIQTATNLRLAELGYEVIGPNVVASATNGRSPTSAQDAARILSDAGVNAAAMYIELFAWEPVFARDGTATMVVGMDAMLVDAPTGQVLWRGHRDAKPVLLYGMVTSDQAPVFAADIVMREVLASLAAKQSTTPRPVRRVWGGPHPR